MIPEQRQISYKEFLALNQADERFEYINGEIFLLASPTVEHQRTLLNLASLFQLHFRGKKCEPLIAPFDVLLQNETDSAPHHVQPDIMVICNKHGLKNNEYRGIPDLIVEIVSPSNTSHDRIRKFNLYMRYGVKEFWLVNPKFNTIEVNVLTSEGVYEQVGVYKGKELATSHMFADLTVNLTEVFGS